MTQHSDLVEEILRLVQDPSKTKPVNPLVEQKVENFKLDRQLKKRYAYWFIGILIVQLLIMNLVFFLVGLHFLQFETWSLNLYTGGTLAEVFGIVLIITKNLFPSSNKQ